MNCFFIWVQVCLGRETCMRVQVSVMRSEVNLRHHFSGDKYHGFWGEVSHGSGSASPLLGSQVWETMSAVITQGVGGWTRPWYLQVKRPTNWDIFPASSPENLNEGSWVTAWAASGSHLFSLGHTSTCADSPVQALATCSTGKGLPPWAPLRQTSYKFVYHINCLPFGRWVWEKFVKCPGKVLGIDCFRVPWSQVPKT